MLPRHEVGDHVNWQGEDDGRVLHRGYRVQRLELKYLARQILHETMIPKDFQNAFCTYVLWYRKLV